MGEGARRPGDRSDISSDDDGESPYICYYIYYVCVYIYM
jgi:hypothetical protein